MHKLFTSPKWTYTETFGWIGPEQFWKDNLDKPNFYEFPGIYEKTPKTP